MATTQYFCLENPMNSMKRQKDITLKDERPRLVGAKYATGEEWRNSSRKNEEAEPKQKKLGKGYVKAIYYHLAYLTYMQNTSCEMPEGMKHKLDSRLLGKISRTSDMQMTPPSLQKAKKN